MFKSELPRMFWKQHGRLRRATSQRKDYGDFALVTSQEYLKSVNEGPPERLYIRPSTGNTHDQISTSKWPSAVKFGIGLAVCASLTYTAKSAMSGLGRRIGI